MTLRVGFVSLGCPKNLVDSEVMMGHLARAGAVMVTDPQDAEVVIVNTCGFIDTARAESVEAILEASELKTTGRCRRLVVAGCLVQRAHEELRREIPEIDAFVGLDDIPGILGIAAPELAATPGSTSGPLLQFSGNLALRGPGQDAPRKTIEGPATWIYDHDAPRLLTGPRHSAYLKISEGCDNPCTFCAIPSFRGAYRSRRLGSILEEAERLAAAGVSELNLIAQDSTHYGHDLGFADGPARLLRALDEVTSLRWIRLFYLYPNRVTDSLLDAIAGSQRIVKYLDIPLQSASRTVLGRMQRGGSSESHRMLLDRMRRRIHGLVLRSTFIVGFPGETETEFRETLDFVREIELDHVGVFTYSHEESTAAFSLVDDVPAQEKEERRARILETQEPIARRKNRARIGKTIEVLCEGIHPESDDLLVGRHAGQAPEIDGSVILNEGEAEPGQFIRAEVIEAHAFDIVARILAPASPGARA